jgi:uncharacterized membrane protein YukC
MREILGSVSSATYCGEKGEPTMALVKDLQLIKFDDLDDNQRRELTQRLKVRRQELQEAMKAVNQGLAKLSKKKAKPKKKKG